MKRSVLVVVASILAVSATVLFDKLKPPAPPLPLPKTEPAPPAPQVTAPKGAGIRGVCRPLKLGSAVFTGVLVPGCHGPQLERSKDRGGEGTPFDFAQGARLRQARPERILHSDRRLKFITNQDGD